MIRAIRHWFFLRKQFIYTKMGFIYKIRPGDIVEYNGNYFEVKLNKEHNLIITPKPMTTTTDNEYYTPEIEEFHVGFECEEYDPDFQGQSDGNQWKKKVFDEDDIISTLKNWKYYQDYRVKRLCHEDIILCGWMEQGVLHYHTGEMIDGYGRGSYILHKTDSGYAIYRQDVYNEYSGNWTQHDVFVGTIKNISELRRIMKQVGI